MSIEAVYYCNKMVWRQSQHASLFCNYARGQIRQFLLDPYSSVIIYYIHQAPNTNPTATVNKPRARGVDSSSLTAPLGCEEPEGEADDDMLDTDDAPELEAEADELLDVDRVADAGTEVELESEATAESEEEAESERVASVELSPTTAVGAAALGSATVKVAPSHTVLTPSVARVMAGPPIEVTTVNTAVSAVSVGATGGDASGGAGVWNTPAN